VSILTLVTIFYVLYIGASIATPFVISLLLSFAILTVFHFFESKGVRPVLAFISSLTFYIAIFWIITLIINSNIAEIVKQAPIYQEKLIRIVNSTATEFNIDRSIILQEINNSINIPQMLS